jgi:hypothetical protein
VTGVRLTHIGGPTVLIQVGGWRLLAKEAEEFVRALDLEYGRKPSTFH